VDLTLFDPDSQQSWMRLVWAIQEMRNRIERHLDELELQTLAPLLPTRQGDNFTATSNRIDELQRKIRRTYYLDQQATTVMQETADVLWKQWTNKFGTLDSAATQANMAKSLAWFKAMDQKYSQG